MDEGWVFGKMKGNIAESIARFIMESAGYECTRYGIERHNRDIIKRFRGQYDTDTKKKLLSTPDFVAINKETNEPTLVEVKLCNNLTVKDDRIVVTMKYQRIENYQEFWNDAIMFIVSNTPPHFFIVPIKDFDKEKHYHGHGPMKNTYVALWNISKIYKKIEDYFPNVKEEDIEKAKNMIVSGLS